MENDFSNLSKGESEKWIEMKELKILS
jgi:hypothetical protein